MGLTNVAGVFSRYFIVGFFVPAFFGLLALVRVVDPVFLPHAYRQASPTGQVAVVGGGALLAGLILLGLNYPVLRLYEGYPLRTTGRRNSSRRGRLTARQHRRCEELRAAADDPDSSESQRFTAAWRLDQRFPHDAPDLILPTAFGNAVRAFERHSMVRWRLNAIGAWPHVEMLLTPQEAQVHADAKSDLAFFLNSSLVAVAATPILAASRIWHGGGGAWYVDGLVALAPLPVAVAAYRAAIGAAIRWGSAVRASMDLHRREVYRLLGVRAPTSFTDERELGYHLNGVLLAGERMPDKYILGPDHTCTTNVSREDGHHGHQDLPGAEAVTTEAAAGSPAG